jgi:DNA-binding GntR family transcriptional regulator
VVLLQLDRDYEPPQVEEHRAILAALLSGDRSGAAMSLGSHLDRAAERLRHLISVRKS